MKTIRKILENQAGIDGKPRVSIEDALKEIQKIRHEAVPKKQYINPEYLKMDNSRVVNKEANAINLGHNEAIDRTHKNIDLGG